MGIKGSAILNIFKRFPEDVSTSLIMQYAFPEGHARIERCLKSSNPEIVRRARTEKLVLRRRALYHLNRYAQKDVVRVHRIDNNGEKFFSLNLHDNEEFVFDYKKKKLNITKIKLPPLPIEGYEKKKIMVKFGASDWLDSFNSILFSCKCFKNKEDMYDSIVRAFGFSNDAIGLSSFEDFLNSVSQEDLIKFYENLSESSRDFGRWISLEIDLGGIEKSSSLKTLIGMNMTRDDNVNIIFSANSKSIRKAEDLLREALSLASNNGKRVYIKNNDIVKSPYMLGNAGPYMTDEKEWKPDVKGLVIGQTTLMIDVKKFSEDLGFSIVGFEDLMTKTSKSIFSGNSMQRRNAYSYFEKLFSSMDGDGHRLLATSNNYIRFWNYDWLKIIYDEKMMKGIFEHMKRRVDDFCASEETIYKSCGMPIRFKIAFSIANTEIYKSYFATGLEKIRLVINGVSDLHRQDVKDEIKSREELFKIFSGGFQVNFHRKGMASPDDMMMDVRTILNDYSLPFFSYKNDDMKGIKNITSFL